MDRGLHGRSGRRVVSRQNSRCPGHKQSRCRSPGSMLPFPRVRRVPPGSLATRARPHRSKRCALCRSRTSMGTGGECLVGGPSSETGNYAAGSATLELSLSKAEAAGDLRLAALARIHLARVRRALGDDASDRAALAKVFRRPSTRSTKCPGWSSGSSRFLMRPTPPARLPSSRLHWTRALDALARLAAVAGHAARAGALTADADRR
jgi:hypothetical protein